jgi:hypothetical protein
MCTYPRRGEGGDGDEEELLVVGNGALAGVLLLVHGTAVVVHLGRRRPRQGGGVSSISIGFVRSIGQGGRRGGVRIQKRGEGEKKRARLKEKSG